MSESPDAKNCLNCGAELHGTYCAQCGQQVASAHLDLHHLAHEAFHEFLHLDGKVVRTMALLVSKPGVLTRDFVEGRRARHISPIRLYLLWSVIFFGLVAYFGYMSKIKTHLNPSTAAEQGAQGTLKNDFVARLQHGTEKVGKDPELLNRSLLHSVPKAMFILMPVFAVLVMLFYRKDQRFYVPHFYFSIHVHTFAFCLFSVSVLLTASGITLLKGLGTLIVPLVVPYFVIALRTVYGGSWPLTIAKGLAISAIHFFVLCSGVIGILLFTLLTV